MNQDFLFYFSLFMVIIGLLLSSWNLYFASKRIESLAKGVNSVGTNYVASFEAAVAVQDNLASRITNLHERTNDLEHDMGIVITMLPIITEALAIKQRSDLLKKMTNHVEDES